MMESVDELTDTVVERGSTNVYADLGFKDAEAMLVKAQLVDSIAAIIQKRHWTQEEAARAMGLSQPKLSGILRGLFRGVSEAKLLQCLTALGSSVEIVIYAPMKAPARGHITVARGAQPKRSRPLRTA